MATMLRSERAHFSVVPYYYWIFVIIIVLEAAPFSTVTFAHSSEGYRNEQSAAEDNSDWMKNLAGSFPMSSLSIPGTHDSGAYTYGRETTETQEMRIPEQLKAGIRVFDIRLGNNHLNFDTECVGPDLYTFHGISCQFEKFKDVLEQIKTFLQDHSGEVAFMRVKFENGPNGDTFTSQVETEMDSFPNLFFGGIQSNPRLDDVRGKIVLLRDYGGSTSIRGIRYNSLKIQDEYSLGTNWDLYKKWNNVKTQLVASDDSTSLETTTFVNYLSASGGGFPYFFASGHSSWETGAPNLLTGWTRGIINTCNLGGVYRGVSKCKLLLGHMQCGV